MVTTYLDSLEDGELDDLNDAIQQGATKQSPKIDALVARAPKTKELVFYKYYKDGPQFKTGGGLREPGYLVVSAEKPPAKAGSVIAEFTIPGDRLKAIEFPTDEGTVYFFGFGATVLFFPERNGVVPATIEDAFGEKAVTATGSPSAGSPVPVARIQFNTGYVPSQEEIDAFEAGEGSIEEFYNKNHGKGGLFTSGRGGGGGGQGNQNNRNQNQNQRNQNQRNPDQRNHPPNRPPFKEKTKLQKIAAITRDVLAVVAIVTVAITIVSFGQRQQERSQRAKDYKLDEPVREKRRQEGVKWMSENGPSKKGMSDHPPKLMDGYHYDSDGKVTRTPGASRSGPDQPGAHPPGHARRMDDEMAKYFDNPSSMVD